MGNDGDRMSLCPRGDRKFAVPYTLWGITMNAIDGLVGEIVTLNLRGSTLGGVARI